MVGVPAPVPQDQSAPPAQGVTDELDRTILVGLEQVGLVERHSDPSDGRAKLVVPTKQGATAMRRGFEVAQSIRRRWTDLIGPREMQRLMHGLGKLVSALADERSAAMEGED